MHLENLSQFEAATLLVGIHDELIRETFLGSGKRAELMFEEGTLWDEYFLGVPYEHIALMASVPRGDQTPGDNAAGDVRRAR